MPRGALAAASTSVAAEAPDGPEPNPGPDPRAAGAPPSPDQQDTVQLSRGAAGALCPGVGLGLQGPGYRPPRRAAALRPPRRQPLADIGTGARAGAAGAPVTGAAGPAGDLQEGPGAAPPGARGCACADGPAGAREGEDPDETVPLVNGGLARRALRGRQSIAPAGVRARRKPWCYIPGWLLCESVSKRLPQSACRLVVMHACRARGQGNLLLPEGFSAKPVRHS